MLPASSWKVPAASLYSNFNRNPPNVCYSSCLRFSMTLLLSIAGANDLHLKLASQKHKLQLIATGKLVPTPHSDF